MAENSAGEKTEEATPKKRMDARKQGTVAKSQDLSGALGLLAIILALPTATSAFGRGLTEAFRSSTFAAPVELSQNQILKNAAGAAVPCLIGSLILIAAVMASGLLVNFAQVGFVLSGESLKPSLAKINPFAGFKRLFSMRQSVEGIKAFAKAVLFSLVAYFGVASQWDMILALNASPPSQALRDIASLIYSVLVRICILWVVIGVLDYLFQRKQVNKELMMTKDELRREMKEQEGSPEVKGEFMRRRRKLLKGGLQQQVKSADVVITNPTHFAVALKYERSKDHAPIVVAKGADHLAAKIREVAAQNKVAIVPNPPLARALYKQCEVGDFVPRDLFGPVAEILAYVLQAVKKGQRVAPNRTTQ